MVPVTSREIRLVARPQGVPDEGLFEVVETDVPDPADGQILIRNAYLSVDPYMRGRMNDRRSYVAPYALGEAMTGGAVGRVAASRNGDWPEGTWVLHSLGWREWALSDGHGLWPVEPAAGARVDGTGRAGNAGLHRLVRPHRARAAARGRDGIRVRCGRRGRQRRGPDRAPARLPRRRQRGLCREARLAARESASPRRFPTATARSWTACATPRRTGSTCTSTTSAAIISRLAIGSLRLYGRVVACGHISRYNDLEAQPGPRNMFMVVTKRLAVRGFIISDHYERYGDFLQAMGPWVRDGRVQYRETVVEGIENAPGAFLGLLGGENVGKMLVQVGPAE